MKTVPHVHGGLARVAGIRVGHDTDLESGTGCTVILCPPEGAIGGVDVRGPAPATRETDLLRPGHLVERVNAILLTGGSAFGLDAASGVMRYLQEQQVGFETTVARVPIVAAAAIFDLAIGKPDKRPVADSGYRACLAATSRSVAEGNVGAGTGATVGHLLGPAHATKSGLGSAAFMIPGGPTIAALIVVNAFGDVIDPDTGKILAGARGEKGDWLDTGSALIGGDRVPSANSLRTNTTIGVVATDAALTKEQANLVAMMAHDGFARAIRPAHTMSDGDVVFVVSTGSESSDVTTIGHTATLVVAQAILRAVDNATGLHGIPSRNDMSVHFGV